MFMQQINATEQTKFNLFSWNIMLHITAVPVFINTCFRENQHTDVTTHCHFYRNVRQTYAFYCKCV